MPQIQHFFNTIVAGAHRDIRVRWGLGAGASVLLSAGVLGMGGTFLPSSLHAATATPQLYAAQAQGGLQIIDMSTSTVAEIIGALPQAERYELMLYNSAADEVLKGGGEYTVFVPASSYFDYLPKGYIAGLGRVEMRGLALGHIVSRTLPIEESLNGDVITLGRTTVAFTVDAAAQKVTVGVAQVLKAYRASNGMVYIINKVLVNSGNFKREKNFPPLRRG